MRDIDSLLEEYGDSHRNPVNKALRDLLAVLSPRVRYRAGD